MTKLTINGKEFKLYFGYAATAKSGIIQKLVQLESASGVESIQSIIDIVPELFLIALQKNHFDEYGFTTDEEKQDKINKACDLLDDYFEDEENDIRKLLELLQEELMNNGFLAGIFREQQKVAGKAAKRKKLEVVED